MRNFHAQWRRVKPLKRVATKSFWLFLFLALPFWNNAFSGKNFSGSVNVAMAGNTVSATNFCANSKKVPMVSFTLNTTKTGGGGSNPVLSAYSFTTTGTYAAVGDIGKFQLWTNTSNNLTTATQLGVDITTTLGTGTHSFTTLAKTLVIRGGFVYFWVTVDVAASPLNNNTIAVNAPATGDLTFSISPNTKSGSGISSGTQTLKANSNISLASGNNIQTICLNTAISDIIYSVGGGATGAGVAGLPAGVSGSFNAGAFTISGTPTVSGTFNYSVTTTGPCTNSSFSGIITVNPNSSISLTSGNNIQTVCINNAIADITYAVGGSGTGAEVTGLPAGVTGSFSAGVFTISGTPTVAGTFNYIVSTTGPCTNSSFGGTITARANPTISLISGNNIQTICISTTIDDIIYTVDGGAAEIAGLPAGVTGSFNAGMLTVSGTPTVSGTFTYTVTTTGPCTNSSLGGTITVNPNASISLISGAGTDAQIGCLNTAITNIVYTVGVEGTEASVIAGALPAGLTASFAAGVFTISGTPTVTGTFDYTVGTSGSSCVNTAASGTITVNPIATISLISGNNIQTVCLNTTIIDITYTVGGGGTGAGTVGLPAGLTGSFNAGVFTISGTPTIAGTFNYIVTTTGPCSNSSLGGTITVNPNASISLT
jgi:hypothetical protein